MPGRKTCSAHVDGQWPIGSGTVEYRTHIWSVQGPKPGMSDIEDVHVDLDRHSPFVARLAPTDRQALIRNIVNHSLVEYALGRFTPPEPDAS